MDETIIAILFLAAVGFTLAGGGILFLRWHERRYPGDR